MKKAISILMCLFLILSTFTFVGISASAGIEYYRDGYYTYTVSNGKATITNCNQSISGDITIPSKLGGYPVTSIGDYAFSCCSSLTSVTIPDSVTSIGDGAFSSCDSLTSVTIPNSVTRIGDDAFSCCSSLKSVTIPDNVTSIGSSAFYGTAYYNNESNWENDVLYIGNHLIKAKTTISGNYTIKNGTKLIADSAFYDCDSLTSITIPNSVTRIDDWAFYNCSSLTSVTIGDSVTSIGNYAFNYCSATFHYNCTNTYVLKYLKNSSKTVVPIHDFNNYISNNNATCSENGTETSKCSRCDVTHTRQIEGTALGHSETVVRKTRATYFANGYTGDTVCYDCGEVLENGSTIKKLTLKTPKFTLTKGKKLFKVKYTKVKDATGFEVRYKLGNGKYKTVKVNTKKSLTKTIKNLKKGKYQVQIRAFIKQNKKTAYSQWSATKSVTVK